MNKKIANEVAVGVILVLLIVIGGLFWMQSKKTEEPKSQAVIQQSESQIEQVQKTAKPEPVDETANWKIYSNTKYGFEFKYPEEFSLKDGEDNSTENLESKNLLDGPTLSNKNGSSISFQVFGNPELLSLHDYINKNKYNDPTSGAYKDPKYKDLRNAGWNNKKVGAVDVWSNGFQTAMGGFESETYLQDTQNIKNVVVTNFSSTPDATKELANSQYGVYTQILSTFKFTK